MISVSKVWPPDAKSETGTAAMRQTAKEALVQPTLATVMLNLLAIFIVPSQQAGVALQIIQMSLTSQGFVSDQSPMSFSLLI